MDETRWRGWVEVRRGRWLKVPPRQCPACAATWGLHRGRPGEGFVRCGCVEPFWHTLWTCQVCGAVAAEGCLDVGRWHNHTTPVEITARWAVRPAALDGQAGDY